MLNIFFSFKNCKIVALNFLALSYWFNIHSSMGRSMGSTTVSSLGIDLQGRCHIKCFPVTDVLLFANIMMSF